VLVRPSHSGRRGRRPRTGRGLPSPSPRRRDALAHGAGARAGGAVPGGASLRAEGSASRPRWRRTRRGPSQARPHEWRSGAKTRTHLLEHRALALVEVQAHSL
jgi:hypothetical protein